MDANQLEKLNAWRRKRIGALVITCLETGESQLFNEKDIQNGSFDGIAEKVMKSGRSGVHTVDGEEYFFNAHIPAPRLVVIGAVHISQALVSLSNVAGFDLEIIDPRTAFATPERFNGVNLKAEWPQDVLREGDLDPYTALAAVTHDPKIDDYPLSLALRANCFYVGALGSRKTHAVRCERLAENGLNTADIERIHAPIGLNIGASSPGEIAVAIVAEVISALRLRDVAGPSEQTKQAAE